MSHQVVILVGQNKNVVTTFSTTLFKCIQEKQYMIKLRSCLYIYMQIHLQNDINIHNLCFEKLARQDFREFCRTWANFLLFVARWLTVLVKVMLYSKQQYNGLVHVVLDSDLMT